MVICASRVIPKNKKSLIFVIFRGCTKNYEIEDFWFFGIDGNSLDDVWAGLS